MTAMTKQLHVRSHLGINAKDFCDFFVSWEIQDNKKLSDILICRHVDSNNPVKLDGGDSISETTINHSTALCNACFSGSFDLQEIKFQPIFLKPFLHPEITKASQCELRVVLPAHCNLRIQHLIVVSSSRLVELCDRYGEPLITVKGEKIITPTNVTVPRSDAEHSSRPPCPSGHTPKSGACIPNRWFRCMCVPPLECNELVIKFVGNSDPNLLHLRLVGLEVAAYEPSNSRMGIFGGVGASKSPVNLPIGVNQMHLMERLYDLLRVALMNPPQSLHTHSVSVATTTDDLFIVPNSDASCTSISSAPEKEGEMSSLEKHHHFTTNSEPTLDVALLPLQQWLDDRFTKLEEQVLQHLDLLTNKVIAMESRLVVEPTAQLIAEEQSQTKP